MRVLRRIDICGRDFTIVESTEDESPDLEGVDGLCDPDQAVIYIQAAQAETVRIDTLIHEMMHACIEATGLRVTIAEKNADGEDLEETIIRALTPSLRGALRSAGWREPKRIGKAPRKPRKKAV